MEYRHPRALSANVTRVHRIRDSRICTRCGARAGNCPHLEADNYERAVTMREGSVRTPALAYTDAEVRAIHQLWADGRTTGQIAELLNRSRSSIAGKMHSLGMFGGVN